MAEYEFDLPLKSSPEILAERDKLADEACRALTQAGIPVHRVELGGGPEGRPGAEVHMEATPGGRVVVDWNTGVELTTAAVKLLEGALLEGGRFDPANQPFALRHHSTVRVHMRDALLGILTSAGFDVEVADEDDYGAPVLFVNSFRRP
ncbi:MULTISPECIES: hypothetical protein [Streptomyces]|uniref:hypothetical protein n=1 Tax=Streptomyces TaxID=1883 RepID=UPI001E2A1331|nr:MULTISPECIES: hypothetical protein [Streptomyces]UFQ19867.1 hypothetical protein J2N69_35640 [Streptomyces huasconensis]WCL89491.1 hypothetical protein PPN52_35590 [Streptomyces sp. JCM 35825]